MCASIVNVFCASPFHSLSSSVTFSFCFLSSLPPPGEPRYLYVVVVWLALSALLCCCCLACTTRR